MGHRRCKMALINQTTYNIYLSDFNTLDANGNGVLDGDELSELLKLQLGRAPTADEIKVFMLSADVDKNGALDLNDFSAMVGNWQQKKSWQPRKQPTKLRRDLQLTQRDELYYSRLSEGPPALSEPK